jgi:hypothetical protein
MRSKSLCRDQDFGNMPFAKSRGRLIKSLISDKRRLHRRECRISITEHFHASFYELHDGHIGVIPAQKYLVTLNLIASLQPPPIRQNTLNQDYGNIGNYVSAATQFFNIYLGRFTASRQVYHYLD